VSRRTLLVISTGLLPGAAACLFAGIHAQRFIACLDEMPLEVAGAWVGFSVLITFPAGLILALWIAWRPTVGSVEIGRSLGWANLITGCISLLATFVGVLMRDGAAIDVFGTASLMEVALSGLLLWMTRPRRGVQDDAA